MTTNPKKQHDERTLPLWVQERLGTLRYEILNLQGELTNLKRAKEILDHREWFPLYGPVAVTGDTYKLWYFEHNDPRIMCTLHYKDVLIIGRHRDNPEERSS